MITILPERSEMREGWATWDIEADGGGTLVRYVAEVEPKFWIPPVIGPLIIKAALRSRDFGRPGGWRPWPPDDRSRTISR